MLAEFQTRFDAIEEKKVEALRLVRALPEERQVAVPRPKDWSPRGVLHHLVISEEEIAGEEALEKAALLPAQRNRRAELFLPMAGMVMRLGLRVPTLPSLEPDQTFPLSDVERRWQGVRHLLHERLSAHGEKAAHRPFALHPMVGPVSALQYLEITDAHLLYHLKQLHRAAKG